MRMVDIDCMEQTNANTEWVDGFLLGDGHIEESTTRKGRASCGQEFEEFANYLMSGFDDMNAGVVAVKEASMKSGTKYCGRTYFDEQLYTHRKRWYSETADKQPPDDVTISPTSVMLWYLGDGSQTPTGSRGNSIQLRLSTDGFSRERVEFLAGRLQETGILCHRNNDNRIYIEAKGIPAFFNFIGRKSPVRCYEYKFSLPEWRFEAKRMSDVAAECGVSYHHLAYLVKIGKVPCYRASAKGRPRMLPEHIEIAKRIMSEEGLAVTCVE